MADLQAGDRAPEVALGMGDGSLAALSTFLERPLVLYFYPKDDTSGCTAEAKEFSAAKAAFDMAGVGVIGVSKNSAKDHARFTGKHDLTILLATDVDGAVCDAFGTWVEKSMYGRKYMGIDRATFLIDRDGRIVKVWRKVKVPGHADEVLAAAEALTRR